MTGQVTTASLMISPGGTVRLSVGTQLWEAETAPAGNAQLEITDPDTLTQAVAFLTQLAPQVEARLGFPCTVRASE